MFDAFISRFNIELATYAFVAGSSLLLYTVLNAFS